MSKNPTPAQTPAGAELVKAEQAHCQAIENHESYPVLLRRYQECNDALGRVIMERVRAEREQGKK